MKRRNNAVYSMSIAAIRITIRAIFSFVPGLSTINLGLFNITLMGIPVAVISCLFGPIGGTLAGLVWGTFSRIQGLTGRDPSGPVLFQYSPIGFLVTVYLARRLAGFLAGFFYDLIHHFEKKGYIASRVASASVSLFNTVFFLFLYACFFFSRNGTDRNALAFFAAAFISSAANFGVEVSVNLVFGSVTAFSLKKAGDQLGLSFLLPHRFVKKEPKKEETAPSIEK